MAYFPNVEKVVYEGPQTTNDLAFRHYNPSAEVPGTGQTQKEVLRFALAYWHTMTQEGKDIFGDGTFDRNWFGATPMETAHNRVDAFFEILEILDVDYFCFHDVDIAPEGESLEEFFANLDEIVDHIQRKMQETGKKLLWNTANAFSNPRFAHGAASSPSADVFAWTAALIKKGLDISKKLGGQNYVFWGGREGYENLLNTDMGLELDNVGRLFKMAIDYSDKIGHQPMLLIEPKPKEPSTHQYDFDAATALQFIQKYGLEGRVKLNLEANHATLAGHTFQHEMNVARINDSLGSLDANQGNMLLGWDTDEFPVNVYDTTFAMYEILKQGGIAPGGINFDAKPRRTSSDQMDILYAHIAGMDTFARGLVTAAKLIEDNFIDGIRDARYASYKEGIGASIMAGKEDLESLSTYALGNGQPKVESSHIELIQNKLNDYLF